MAYNINMNLRLAAVRDAFIALVVEAGGNPDDFRDKINGLTEEQLLEQMHAARYVESVVEVVGAIKNRVKFDDIMNRALTDVFTGEDDLKFLIRRKGSGSPER